jgi:hypothetical protein
MKDATHLAPRPVLDGLKDFQRTTVDYVFNRLYTDNPPAHRFLVADEVGLGKTLVARGVIARAIEHLQQSGVDRIDVVYICSNADIARQNVNRLNVTGRQEFNLPTRLTMLPVHLHQLNAHGINFVSFTPGTAFDLKSRGGLMEERALIYWLLRYAWGWPKRRHDGVFRILRGTADLGNFRKAVDWSQREIGAASGQIDPGLAESFKIELAKEAEKAQARGEPSLHDRFDKLADRYRGTGREVDWDARQQLVGDLRHTLARSCVNALEPDLVILDEFQRFRNLLDGEDAAAELAEHLFTQETARVLLLSATPYKLYTLPEESQSQDDHYADFLQTTRFLMGESESRRFADDLRAFRQGLVNVESADLAGIRARRHRVERRLRRVMCRTERLAVTVDRNGMLAEQASTALQLEPADLRAFLATDRVSRRLGTGEVLEYWKSAPYLLNFMESYKLKQSFRKALEEPNTQAELTELLGKGDGLLAIADIEAYKRIDAGNARLRALINDTLDRDAWRLLWLPPALPYYQPGPPFDDARHAVLTKRLVFSAWWVVPQVIATLVSYEAERRMVQSSGRNLRNTLEARRRVRPLLRFQRQGDRVAGMPLFALMYPSPSLARLADPLQLVADRSAVGQVPTRAEVIASARQRIERALRSILSRRGTGVGPVDERWYWAAPLLLDAKSEPETNAAWLGRANAATVWQSEQSAASDGEDSTFDEAVINAREIIKVPGGLGRVPEDLPDVLAKLALAGPAVCALRALACAAGGIDRAADNDLRDGAARAASGFRSLFNIPEVMAMVRGPGQHDDEAYWQKTLDYCLNGNLQAVLDEYAHVLREWLGILDRDPVIIGRELGQAIHDALTVRAANYRVEDIRADAANGLQAEQKNLRARFALRFGAQNAEEGSELQRASQIRYAFNSPFWPFVLATTSVGQEGLDFHLYCHAVVHWNLPANPVDLEQREGRVHRFKGHAIRKNVAAANRVAGFKTRGRDPWEELFKAARRGRAPGSSDLVPYWVYPTEGGAHIDRYVPALPLSREIEKLEQLKRSLAVYRLAFGQPRQDDLTAYLARIPESRREEIAVELRIDLTPSKNRR